MLGFYVCEWKGDESTHVRMYKVVQIWPGQTVTCLHTNSPGHIWTTLYASNRLCRVTDNTESYGHSFVRIFFPVFPASFPLLNCFNDDTVRCSEDRITGELIAKYFKTSGLAFSKFCLCIFLEELRITADVVGVSEEIRTVHPLNTVWNFVFTLTCLVPVSLRGTNKAKPGRSNKKHVSFTKYSPSRRFEVINCFYYAGRTFKIKVIPFLIHGYGLSDVNTIPISW